MMMVVATVQSLSLFPVVIYRTNISDYGTTGPNYPKRGRFVQGLVRSFICYYITSTTPLCMSQRICIAKQPLHNQIDFCCPTSVPVDLFSKICYCT